MEFKLDKRIKVLHIIKTLNVGGAEMNLLHLANALSKEKVEVHVAYSGIGDLEDRFQLQGHKLFKFSKHTHKLKSVASIGIVWKLFWYLKKNKIDIVHTHTFNTHLWGVVAAKLAGCAILEHVHDSRYMDPAEFAKRGEKSTQYAYVKLLRNLADVVVVLTPQNVRYIEEQKLHQKQKIHWFYNGLDTAGIKILTAHQKSELRNRLGIAEDASIVLTPIRFSPEKNLEVLFEITKGIVRGAPQTVCLIAGDGPDRLQFEQKIKTEGLEKQIKTIGYYSDIPELLAISDVFLLPSTIELHSIAILEALRQSVPVVISKGVGCHDEFIENGVNGVLLDPFEAEGWSKAILQLLNQKELAHRIGNAGHETFLRLFDIKRIAHQFEDLYCELAHS